MTIKITKEEAQDMAKKIIEHGKKHGLPIKKKNSPHSTS